MSKRILTLVLIAAMLFLASCKVVEVIDHATTTPEETTATTTPPQEYSPWGFWHSYDSSTAVELIENGSIAKLYSLTIGYYEYYHIGETTFTRDGDTFTVAWEEKTYVFTFDKLTNTLVLLSEDADTEKETLYVHMNEAPQKHSTYSYPDYTQCDASTYVSVGEMDLTTITPLIFEGAPYDIAVDFYGDIDDIPMQEEVSRPAQKGDVVNIDYCGKLDGVAFTGGTATDVALFISDYKNGYIPGFTDGIIGRSVGETFDVNVTFPQEYHAPDLAGKAVVFTMTLNGICDLSLSDEQVAEYPQNQFKTYDEWLRAERMNITTSLFAETVFKACTKITDLPKESYMYFYQQTVDYYHMVAYYYNIDYKLLLSYSGLNEAAFLQQAINTAVYNLALYVIAEENDLSWSEEDYTAKYEGYVSDYMKDNKDALEKEAREYADRQISQIKHELTEEAVLIWAFDSIFPSEKE